MPNLSEIKRDKMLAFLKQLKEQHTDNDTLISINEIENELMSKKYGLVWEQHEEEVDQLMRQNVPVFYEVPEREVKYAPDNDDYNFLLEGDNLHSLYLLEKTHSGRIDVIYIDPPYNTGAKNWKYNNDFVDKNDMFKHSKWISFMEHRLLIAKRLLSPQGTIIVTIDDYEIENILMLMNEIFGEDCHLGTAVIKSNPQGRSSVTGFQISHEYALFYSKKAKAKIGRLPKTDEQIARYDESDDYGPFEWRNFRAQYSMESQRMVYPIYIKKDLSGYRVPPLKWNNDEDKFIALAPPLSDEIVSMPQDETGRMRTWKWGLDTLEQNKETETCVRRDRSGTPAVYYKGRMTNLTKQPYTFWDDPKYSASTFGANILAEILGPKKFDYPKSIFAVMDCLRIATEKDDALILDFFAGSGTTGHAVLALNKEDKGKRKFILCTNNENNICEDVTYPRIKTIITGMKPDSTEYITSKVDILLKEKINFTLLKNTTNLINQIRQLKTDYASQYTRIEPVVQDNCILLLGINLQAYKGIPSNLKYYKTKFIPKIQESQDYLVGDQLMLHIKEMIQLENGISIDNEKYIMLLDDNDAEELERHPEKLSRCKAVYLSKDVLLSKLQQQLLSSIEKKIIPDYYFENELREVHEL